MINQEDFLSGKSFKAIERGIPNDWQFHYDQGFVMMRRSEEGSGEWTDYCLVNEYTNASFSACLNFFGIRLVFENFLFFDFELIQEGGTDGV